jgi:hypothetical protein
MNLLKKNKRKLQTHYFRQLAEDMIDFVSQVCYY